MQCISWKDDAMQCNAMQCNAMQCNAMQCNVIQISVVQCYVVPYNAMVVQYNGLLCYTVIQQALCNGPFAGSMLFQRRRRWANIDPELV